jgi:hypothetical protein
VRRGLLFLAVSLAGCGSGDQPMSHADFVQAGNAICRKYQAEIVRLEQPRTLPAVRAYLERLLPILQRQLGETRELEPPEQDEEGFDRLVEALEVTLANAQSLRQAAQENDLVALQALGQEVQQATDEAGEVARDLGLTACVRGPAG